MENKVNFIIPEEVVIAATQKFKEGAESLSPYLIALTPTERRKMAKMSDKSVSFVEKNLEYSGSASQFTPQYMDCEALAADLKVTQQLTPLFRIVKALTDGLDDTIMEAGSEAYLMALNYYNSVKQAAKTDVPAAKSIYEDLSKRFERTKPAIDTTNPTNGTPPVQ